MDDIILTVIIEPAFHSSVRADLKNQPFPGRPQNYYLECVSPVPLSQDDEVSRENPDIGINRFPRTWRWNSFENWNQPGYCLSPGIS